MIAPSSRLRNVTSSARNCAPGSRLSATRNSSQTSAFACRSAQKASIWSRAAASTADPDDEASLTSAEIVHYRIKGHDFQVTGGSFFQVNLPQAETLVDLVLNRLALQGGERILDLYSGVGLFTAFLAERARFVTAVELYAPAVRDAEVNLLGFTNVDLRVGAIEGALPRGDADAAVDRSAARRDEAKSARNSSGACTEARSSTSRAIRRRWRATPSCWLWAAIG